MTTVNVATTERDSVGLVGVPSNYTHIPKSRRSANPSQTALIVLGVFLLIIALSLFTLAFALWQHPAWSRGVENRLPRALQHLHLKGSNNDPLRNSRAVVPLAHEFQLQLPANYDPTSKEKSRVTKVPWLPSFRRAKSGHERIFLRGSDPSVPPRTISWSVVSEAHPRALLINGTLTPAEANSIIETAKRSFARSKVISGTHGEDSENSVRTSSGMFLVSSEDAQLPANQVLRSIVAAIGGIPSDDWVEATQVLEYKSGQHYVPHPDFYSADDVGNLHRGAQRIYTVLTWLNEVKGGGETTFPNAKLKVHPHTFGSILFYDVDEHGNIDWGSIHGGEPPEAGSVKYVAVNWCHGMPFL